MLLAELARRKSDKIFHTPIPINIRYYDRLIYGRTEVPAGIYAVGVEGEYIIGAVIGGYLCPLLVPRMGRVKVRTIDSTNIPLSPLDTMRIHFYHKVNSRNYPSINVIWAERPYIDIPEK